MDIDVTYLPRAIEGCRNVRDAFFDKVVYIALRALALLTTIFQSERKVENTSKATIDPEIMRLVFAKVLRIEIRKLTVIVSPNEQELNLFNRVVQELDLPKMDYPLVVIHRNFEQTFLSNNRSKKTMNLLYHTYGNQLVFKFFVKGVPHYLLGINGQEYFLRTSIDGSLFYFHPDGHERTVDQVLMIFSALDMD